MFGCHFLELEGGLFKRCVSIGVGLFSLNHFCFCFKAGEASRYEELGVLPNATTEEIRLRYLEIAETVEAVPREALEDLKSSDLWIRLSFIGIWGFQKPWILKESKRV